MPGGGGQFKFMLFRKLNMSTENLALFVKQSVLHCLCWEDYINECLTKLYICIIYAMFYQKYWWKTNQNSVSMFGGEGGKKKHMFCMLLKMLIIMNGP